MAVLSTVGTAVGGGVDETDETADLSAAASAAFGEGLGVEELESCAQPHYIETTNIFKKTVLDSRHVSLKAKHTPTEKMDARQLL